MPPRLFTECINSKAFKTLVVHISYKYIYIYFKKYSNNSLPLQKIFFLDSIYIFQNKSYPILKDVGL